MKTVTWSWVVSWLRPDTLPRPFGYSHVVDAPASRIVYVSGQVPLDTAGEPVGAGDFQAQARQVFVNLNAALEAAGVGWHDVVKRPDVMFEVDAVAIVE